MPERKLECKLDDSQEAVHSTRARMWLQLLGVAACNHAEEGPANKFRCMRKESNPVASA